MNTERPFLILSDFTEVTMQQEVNIDKVLQGKVKSNSVQKK